MDTKRIEQIKVERDRVRSEAAKRDELLPRLKAAKVTAETALGDALVSARGVDAARERLAKARAELEEYEFAAEAAQRAEARLTGELMAAAVAVLLTEHDGFMVKRDELVVLFEGGKVVGVAAELRERAQQATHLACLLLDRAPTEAKLRLWTSQRFDVRGALGFTDAQRIADASIGIKPGYPKPWADVEQFVLAEERAAEQQQRQAHEARLSLVREREALRRFA